MEIVRTRFPEAKGSGRCAQNDNQPLKAGAQAGEVLRATKRCRAEARRYVKEKRKQIPRRCAPRNEHLIRRRQRDSSTSRPDGNREDAIFRRQKARDAALRMTTNPCARHYGTAVTAGVQAARRWERKVRSIGLRASARAARKWSRAGSGRPARSSNSPRAAW